MKKINQTYKIKAPVEEVWKGLTEPEYIDAWGGAPVKMKAEPGFEFSLWGGDIWGKNVEVIPPKKLVQEWFGNDWPKPSLATFTLDSIGEETQLTLIHENLPEAEIDDFAAGWKDFYLGPMKKYLESNHERETKN